MKKNVLKTPHKIRKEARELAIYNEWKELSSQDGAMLTEVTELIMRKYHIYAASTVWLIRRRVEKRLKNQYQQKTK
jgi:hypothetical protein